MRQGTEAIMPPSGTAGRGETRPSGSEAGSRKPASLEVHRAALRRFGLYIQTCRKTRKAPSFYAYPTKQSYDA